ncbi:HesB/IscA family protein [Legionella israelensis]|uniref:Fe-S cluster assembly protein n=1 Tax=Legionella israelensis TaxID=454 RepID=A0A0W0W388_9GAMM|nr:iron-sulfur cluster assembly accessory protein [Legionella israelensis]KTD26896.1 Fe-S cluster assembly protein [Legionella israelensis]QBS08562.1 iron-sulfur cluster assembly accessory protein [Legionella israelensis]QDP72595.1 iron-sulfur cluster assembly accessory protein [Legionella israelensis]SCX76097.1 iron-sulfur cluster assembly protein [Legionella israelensis DSM 19235]STX58214.1 Fe-S cluster assembly protein [Legionella israelensis]
MTIVMQHSNENEPMVSLTPAAERHILTYLSKNDENKGIRFSVKKTGCSGWSYVIDYVSSPEDNDIVTPFLDHYLLCIDKKSYPFLKGMEIDYVKQGLNHKFIFHNPNQTGQCGCGESFTID